MLSELPVVTPTRPNPVTTARTETGTLVPEAGPLTKTSLPPPMRGTEGGFSPPLLFSLPGFASPSSLTSVRGRKKARPRQDRTRDLEHKREREQSDPETRRDLSYLNRTYARFFRFHETVDAKNVSREMKLCKSIQIRSGRTVGGNLLVALRIERTRFSDVNSSLSR